MVATNLSAWIEKKYLEWQILNGRGSVDDFAKLLNISQGYLSQIMSGARKSVSMKTAVKIAKILEDYSILEILNYSLPENKESVPFSSLPPDLQDRLRSALNEIERTLKTRSIQPDSPEGLEISTSVLKKFGFTVNSITNS